MKIGDLMFRLKQNQRGENNASGYVIAPASADMR